MFDQIARLNKEDLKGDELEKELERSKTLTGLSKTIIDNAKVVLDAEKFRADYRGYKDSNFPPMLTNDNK